MNRVHSLLIFTIILCFSLFRIAHSQSQKIKSIGIPFLTNYNSADYDFSSHNFDVIIGDDQKIYFANNQGILVFDGINWTRLMLPKGAPAYTLTKSMEGTIYVGATNEIGYLDSNESGELIYVSLMNQLPVDELGTFTALVHSIGDKIIATTTNKSIVIDPKSKSSIILDNPKDAISFQSVNGRQYAFSEDEQYQFIDNKWVFNRNSSILESKKIRRSNLVQVSENQTIAITQDGFSNFETGENIEIDSEVQKLLGESTIYRASILNENFISICTWSGLLITDLKGNPLLFLNKERGLADNFLYRAELDQHGMLWVATYNGITKIDLLSAYSIFDSRMNVDGVIKDAQLFNGNLYYSAISGVYRSDWQSLYNPFQTPEFSQVTNSVCHQMINTGNDLFVYTERQNNLVLMNERFEEIKGTQDKIYWAGFKYKNSDDLLLASHDGFITHLIKKNGKWVVRKQVDPLFKSVYFLIEGEEDVLWLSDIGEGIFKMRYDVENAKLLDDKNYGKADGLPSDQNNYVYKINNKPCFTTEKGIYRYDEPRDTFSPDERFSQLTGEVPISMIEEDDQGNLYYFSDEFVKLKKTADGYKKIRFPNLDFKSYPPSDLTVINAENVIISSSNAFIHVNPTIEPNINDFNVSITSLSSLKSDSMVYGGFGNIPKNLLFGSDDNALRFSFAATFYQNPECTSYKWKLNGSDEKWSDWTMETQKDYTNLPHGNYTFEVIAKNIHGVESLPARYQFTIVTPWYFTIWAYALYLLTAIGIVWAIVILNSRRLRAINQKLEQLITERTAEIEGQRTQLLLMDDLKRRFFVNISHEFRTPLTLSIGTVDQALSGAYGQLSEQLNANLKVARRNSDRLLKMVTNILDISKFEGGRIQLYAAESDPIITIQNVLTFFSSRFTDKKISIETDFQEALKCYLDEDKFETILINIIANAIKFTPSGGTIKVSLFESADDIIVQIKDSGEGIPEKYTSLVFDRFYQSPSPKSGEGIGVGLALSKELVELHRGTISASNDNGAVFTVRFKAGKDHLEPNQIVEPIIGRSIHSLEDKYPTYAPQTFEFKNPNGQNREAEHILLVEDNQEISQFITGILGNYYQVSTAYDGLEALSFLDTNKPDLIITDYLMPNMDGYEMAIQVKQKEGLEHLPIIFLTARATEQDKINVLNLGVNDYLFKPFSTDELLVRIKNLLYMQKQRLDFIQEESIDLEAIEWKEFPSKLKQEIDEYISIHIKEEITAELLAEYTNQSERSLYRKIKTNTGLSVMGYVKETRLRKARTMLEIQEMRTVSEISYAVGFKYLSHFTKSYKERFGKQPSEYLD